MRVVVEDPGGRKVIIDPDEQREVLSAVAAKSAPGETWDGSGIDTRLLKAVPGRRFTLHVAYPANRPDQHIAADGFRDFAGPDALEDCCWAYTGKSRKVGLWHEPGEETVGAGEIVESYIYRNPQPWVIKAVDGSEQTVSNGDWLIGIRWHPDVWPKVLKGEIGGVSMQGKAARRKPSAEALAQLRS